MHLQLQHCSIAALQWCRSLIQPGTIIILDEYFAFGGSQDRGEALAIKEFSDLFPKILLRQFGTYGAGGVVLIVSDC